MVLIDRRVFTKYGDNLNDGITYMVAKQRSKVFNKELGILETLVLLIFKILCGINIYI